MIKQDQLEVSKINHDQDGFSEHSCANWELRKEVSLALNKYYFFFTLILFSDTTTNVIRKCIFLATRRGRPH